MQQPDLFSVTPAQKSSGRRRDEQLDLASILDRLTASCERPHYTFMLLTLIAEASARTGSAGPFVRVGEERVLIRDWLCDAMHPLARREPRRLAITEAVRSELKAAGTLPDNATAAARVVAEEVRGRLRRSGRTNVSRAVSELVRAGLLRRHYQGYRVDHHNRGAQRHAVYTITDETRRALARRS